MTAAAPLTIVAFALPLGTAVDHPDRVHWQQAFDRLSSPELLMPLRQAKLSHRNTLEATAHSASHEMAWAQALGWQVADGMVPLAARLAQAQGLPCPAEHGWAFIDAVNWHISQGQVNLTVPKPITPEESGALLLALQTFLAQDGIHLHAWQPGRWLAHSPLFKGLPTVSLDRVNGQRIDPWFEHDSIAEQNPVQRQLRRLQNEIQMLFYTHAVNDSRDIALNSVWFSGTGDLAKDPHASTTPAVVLNDDLREAWLSQTPDVFIPAFNTVLRDLIAPALRRQEPVLLCEPTRSVLLQASASGWVHQLQGWWRKPTLLEVLQ
jgi:hypothetical protein